MLPCFQRQRSVSQPYRRLTGLIRAKSSEGIEERCQVERRTNLYRSTGLFVVLSGYNQVVRVTKGSEQLTQVTMDD
jgi:hypothetical protein